MDIVNYSTILDNFIISTSNKNLINYSGQQFLINDSKKSMKFI